MFEPRARLTPPGLVAGLPPIVHVGVGEPVTEKLAEIELDVVDVVDPLAGLLNVTSGAVGPPQPVTVNELVRATMTPCADKAWSVLWALPQVVGFVTIVAPFWAEPARAWSL